MPAPAPAYRPQSLPRPDDEKPEVMSRRARAKMAATVRCDVCGGLHWHAKPLADQCPGE